MNYPTSLIARLDERDRLVGMLVNRAIAEATRHGRSIKCRRDQHAGDDLGCANDATGCLCPCHDPKG